MIDRVYIERFWARFKEDKKTGCLEWTYSKNPKGYGQYMIGGRGQQRRFYTHRLSWMLTFGKIPKGFIVCHKCDNPSCGNPSHLFLGTYKDNTNDMMKKGRHWYIKVDPLLYSKLNFEKAREIRETKHLLSIKQQALKYGVCASTIKNVRKGRTWNGVDKKSSGDT